MYVCMCVSVCLSMCVCVFMYELSFDKRYDSNLGKSKIFLSLYCKRESYDFLPAQ